MANKTVISIPAQNSQYEIEGLWTADQIKNLYSSQIPGLSSMVATTTDEAGPSGSVRVHTFAARVGNKG